MTPASVRVGEVATQIRGVTYAKDDASTVPGSGLVPILRAGNISDSGLTLDDLVYVPKARVADRQFLQPNDVLVASSSGSLSIVGKAARVTEVVNTSFGAFCKVLRPTDSIDPSYFAHYFQTQDYRRRMTAAAAGANINNLRSADLDNLVIPLPPLDEQQRIARVLDAADDLRELTKRQLSDLDSLYASLQHRAFSGEL